MKLTLFLTFFTLLNLATAFGQCTDQVLHSSGSATINGILVTVTSSGSVDTNSAYCVNTFPYMVGYNAFSGSLDGAYHFTFTPAVDSITMNFSGLSNVPPNQEIIVLTVNGQHYSIPAVGNVNVCDPFAELTASGDITGCLGCSVSGWNGTTITGPISSLSVLDSAISGFGNGALFSLFLCSGKITNLEQNEMPTSSQFFPNPVINETTLISNRTLNNATLKVCNAIGQEVKQLTNLWGQKVTLQRDQLPGGLYFFQLTEDSEVISNGKLVLSE
jgi:hypothetical protein